MEHIVLDQNWTLRKGFLDSLSMIQNDPGMRVDLPHDAMISTKVSPNAAAKYDSGYFEGVMCNYTKQILIPMDWNEECIGLQFDGIMMHATIEINGCKVAEHHYGYSPFYVDITKYVTFGGRESNYDQYQFWSSAQFQMVFRMRLVQRCYALSWPEGTYCYRWNFPSDK